MAYSDLLRSISELIDSHGKPKREVYLDNENSGLIVSEALKAMEDAYLRCGRGHPSITHLMGWMSYQSLYEATVKIASAINCNPEEIVYTHSGTEANNLAITGSAIASHGRRKILISSIEHLSVVFPAESLERHGFKVLKIPVNEEGFVNLEFLSNNLDRDTLIVSIATINHEIGTIQDIKAIRDIVKDRDEGILLHTDACDALGRVSLDLKKLGVDLASFSSHKVYGPKGVGALYVKEGVKLEPVIRGQLSTQKLWPGVENVPGIIGFSKAVEFMHTNFRENVAKMSELRDKLINGILSNIDFTVLNGPYGDKRAPDNVNISFLYCEGEALTVELSLNGIYVSSGSACTSRVLEPSHVLLAIGRKYEEAHGSLLMKVTPFHAMSDIDYVLEVLPSVVKRIRSISPLKPKREVK
ncbi:MAG: cysteine desulfurase [Candidatus Nezhaarchaeota archaeon]|nr:cysteine desulfurase [Candidatus Nezhaarchaeota archaeon]MCX8141363.1 cysteine desulfurase [Candidatus Nezhaarchaeota archaeon]MDW8049629.1 cysteine desulfurase family protein [Nitrososphaerota archaeon]